MSENKRVELAPGVWQIERELIEVAYDRHDRPIDWAAVFGRSAPLALEIGAGSGEFLTRIAASAPDTDHVGLEIKNQRVAKFARRIKKSGLANLRVVHGDATRLLACLFLPGSLVAVYFLFPDPWPKKRHIKHRFLNRFTLAMLHDLLRPGGLLHLATDHRDYLESMKQTMTESPGFSGPLYEEQQSPFGFPTRYETYWLAEQRPITYLTYRRD